jgi:hypothetical protein
MKLVVPVGDMADLKLGNSDAVWETDFSVLDKLKTKYGADEVLVTVANKSSIYTKVDFYVYSNGVLERYKTLTPFTSGKSDEEIFKQVTHQAIDDIASMPTPSLMKPLDKKEPDFAMPVRPSSGDVITADKTDKKEAAPAVTDKAKNDAPPAPAMVPAEKLALDVELQFTNFTQWLEVQRRLATVTPTLAIEIVSLNKSAARFGVTLDMAGGMEAFKKALLQRGMMLDMELPAVGDPSKPETLKSQGRG